jgi:hypothetical protein
MDLRDRVWSVWTGFIWLRRGTKEDSFEHGTSRKFSFMEFS